MYLKYLRLFHFKNHLESSYDLSPQINCFVGNNGIGKTNVLDALHYLSIGKSFLQHSDHQNVSFHQDAFLIQSELVNENKTDTLSVHYAINGKKIVKKNDKILARLSDFVGTVPSVVISPYDSNLISDSGESRRKFLDALISQINPEYLHHLMAYHKSLQQRNALLKYFQKNKTFDADSLEVYQHPLSEHGQFIFEKRKTYLEELTPIVQNYYQILSQNKEEINIAYPSDLHENSLEDLLIQSLAKDRVLSYTTKGIHKDDITFEMNGHLLKKIGSLGQQKSFLIAVKLAQLFLMKNHLNKSPILLLDDIFDKLDDHRVSQLISLVNETSFGQIFLTDTNHERTEAIVKRINEESKIFHLT